MIAPVPVGRPVPGEETIVPVVELLRGNGAEEVFGTITELVSKPTDCVWVPKETDWGGAVIAPPVPVGVIVWPSDPVTILILLLESGNGAIVVEDVSLSVRVPDATILLISILDTDDVDIDDVEPVVGNSVVTKLELAIENPELPAVGPLLFVTFETGNGGIVEELEIPEPADGETVPDDKVSVPMVPLGPP